MAIEIGGLATYDVDVAMTANAQIDGEPTQIASNVVTTKGALDLTEYWTSLLSKMLQLFVEGSIDVVEGINTWGDSSTLGGVTVGCGEGALKALQKMGDGVLTATDVLGTASGGVYSEEAELILAAMNEYVHTTSRGPGSSTIPSIPASPP